MKKKIVISFKSTRLRVDVNDFDLLNPKMKLFLRTVLYFGFYWVEKFNALKKRSKGSRRRTDQSNKYPTCLKTVRREQIVRLFAQTSLHTVVSARRTSSRHKSMEMYVGVEQAIETDVKSAAAKGCSQGHTTNVTFAMFSSAPISKRIVFLIFMTFVIEIHFQSKYLYYVLYINGIYIFQLVL